MSIGKRNKDHAARCNEFDPRVSFAAPKSEDPLRFWTAYQSDNVLVDLHPFANGEMENSHFSGGGNWAGPYSGRPKLIEQLAPAIQAQAALAAPGTVKAMMAALRAWWRLFDSIEEILDLNGRAPVRVESVADLNSLHEAAAHRNGMRKSNFLQFVRVVNATRKLGTPRLPELPWSAPKHADPLRSLIPEEQARSIKTYLKQDWERVRRTWAHSLVLLAEVERRAVEDPESNDLPVGSVSTPSFSKEDERLLVNLQHLVRIQKNTGKTLPSSAELSDGMRKNPIFCEGNERRVMRGILFPTVEEMDIAFHLALMNSGWNPSTLANLDGNSPDLVSHHPKNPSQIVLSVRDDENDEIAMQANKPRARGATQFCVGLRKHTASPPMIVATYSERVAALRVQLKLDFQNASTKLAAMQAENREKTHVERQFKIVQRLQKGCRSVWLYVDLKGKINWINHDQMDRYAKRDGTKGTVSYLVRVVERLNDERTQRGNSAIPSITISDFRDIYARWVYTQSEGNLLAVMLALGHASLASTWTYVDNNLIGAENDEHVRRFMGHLFGELSHGRLDLTILAQLVRHGSLTPEMQMRLDEYRIAMRSRIGVACKDPRHPPAHVAPMHKEGRLCGTQRCMHACPNARFLPESLDGMSMRVEELIRISENLPRESWLQAKFQEELDEGEYLLHTLYSREHVAAAREKWHGLISSGEHMVPGLGLIFDIP